MPDRPPPPRQFTLDSAYARALLAPGPPSHSTLAPEPLPIAYRCLNPHLTPAPGRGRR
ncbi:MULTISPECIES: hypothetical protein [Sphingomonas]|uniref:hypothetical protein n=1 Tax=Sphingomonas TaxID=13687 RepID=UPI0013B390E1|nr:MULTISPECIES: hypothetical protein [Sphingomonas]